MTTLPNVAGSVTPAEAAQRAKDPVFLSQDSPAIEKRSITASFTTRHRAPRVRERGPRGAMLATLDKRPDGTSLLDAIATAHPAITMVGVSAPNPSEPGTLAMK